MLELKDISVAFPSAGGAGTLHAVRDASLTVRQGEVFGIVGSSGAGKSTLLRTINLLERPRTGQVLVNGTDLTGLPERELRHARQKIGMIFQHFNLMHTRTVWDNAAFALKVAGRSRAEIRQRVPEILALVGLGDKANAYPDQLSGGQKQRVGIARALALNPELVICDEAVSALDVSIQAQIINLLLDLQKSHGLTYIFIAHDLSVVEFISDRILVMYLGRIVEDAPKRELVEKRLHPYTQALFEASPNMDPAQRGRRTTVTGDLPSPIDPPKGCHFHPRCPRATDLCRQTYPERKEVAPGHFTACHLY